MAQTPGELRRTLGAAARLWADAAHLDAGNDWWLACSGQLNVNYNLAFCGSPDPSVLLGHCLEPVLDIGRPSIIMLAGAGLGTAQHLTERGWVVVGALPLMTLPLVAATDPVGAVSSRSEIRALTAPDLLAARALLSDCYGLDDGSATAAVPDRIIEGDSFGAWGLFEGDRLASCFTGVVQDNTFIVWSMATGSELQGRGYGHRLLQTVLADQFDRGVTSSLLQSSIAGEKLYRGLGYSVVEYWQLWSRPRWVMAAA